LRSSIMASRTSSVISLDEIVGTFDQIWDRSEVSLGKYWQSLGEKQTTSVLSALIKVDLQHRFLQGERPTAAEYFALFPQLIHEDDWALSLVYVEFCLLEENNAHPDVSDFCARYEHWRDSLVSQLGYHRDLSLIMGSERPRVKFPLVGERFATYQLRKILGNGGAARVYLATDDLGGRQVVLKVSPSVGDEPSILASLEHRNIVPILTVAESPESGLRGICMPYRRGKTLEDILNSFSATGLPRKALPIWNLMEVSKLDQDTIDVGWKGFPVRGTYTEAVAWLGLSIANALIYLHEEKGVYHRDIKPANILLANREGPLLFDFNLAHSPHAAEHARAAILGGTLPYMAPEQLGAFLDPSKWNTVGAQADIYALGLVMRELVTGLKPDLPNKSLPLTLAIQDLRDRRHEMLASIREIRPEIPPSLEAIILMCLSYHPSKRYASAQNLSEDLRRFLKRKPLRYAKSSSKLEILINLVYRGGKHAVGLGVLFLLSWLIAVFFQFKSEPANHGPQQAANSGLTSTRPDEFDLDQISLLTTPQKTLFRQGVGFLDSKNSEDWNKARSIFEQLRKETPKSAWPILYLALTIEKLGEREEAHSLLSEALEQNDAAKAIRQRLTKDPRSASLKVLLGVYFYQNNDYGNARQCLDEAIKLDPEHEGAYAALANLALSQKRTVEAIEFYQQAIEVASKKPQNPFVGRFRSKLIPVMLAEVDKLLSKNRDQEKASEQKAIDLLDQVNVHLPLLEEEWKEDIKKKPNSQGACSIAICRGGLNSGWAYLHARGGQKQRALDEFQTARGFFDKALEINSAERIDPKKSLNSRDFGPHIRSQLDELDRRMTRLGLSREPTRSRLSSDPQ